METVEKDRREGENRKLQGSKGFSGHWWVPAKALEEESGSCATPPGLFMKGVGALASKKLSPGSCSEVLAFQAHTSIAAS